MNTKSRCVRARKKNHKLILFTALLIIEFEWVVKRVYDVMCLTLEVIYIYKVVIS